MAALRSDAFVFFGATGDLAYKKIFPALQGMIRRGYLDMPVIGVARRNWTSDQLRARLYDSLEKYGGVDPDAFAKLSTRLQYLSGDYGDEATYARLRINACGNTMRGQNVALKDLLPGFAVAERGGVVLIADLQAQGYVYLRP